MRSIVSRSRSRIAANRLRTVSMFSSATAKTYRAARGRPGPDDRSASERTDDQEQQHGAPDRDQPGAEIEEVVDVADVEGARDQPTDQGAEDSHRGCAETAAGLGSTGNESARDQAGEQSEEDPGDDSHAALDPTGRPNR